MKKIINILILTVLLGCSKVGHKEEKVNIYVTNLKSLTENENLFSIRDYHITNDRLYIIDNQEDKIRVFDLKGKFLFDFGSKGKGPGQFIDPKSITGMQDNIIVLDLKKKAIIKFDFNGKFREETKTREMVDYFSIFRDYKFVNDSILFAEESYVKDKKNYFKKSYYQVKTNSLIIQDTLYSIERAINPKKYDLFDKNSISIDLSNNRVIKSNKSRKEISFSIIDLKSSKENIINREFSKIKFSEKIVNDYTVLFSKQEKANPSISFLPVPKYRFAISDFAIQKNGNIWVTSPTVDDEKKILSIFNKKGVFLTEIFLKNANSIEISDNYLFCHKLDELSGSVLKIYEIKE